ncbi:signal peptidase II [Deinococcus aquatilis]|uniref:signal peptidase II n=1 Tax=Deinococcus aquatilis TaxID=519440 RepID=UPI0003A4E4B3|nr:signal peptidase II [Deinococcus aquatilis]
MALRLAGRRVPWPAYLTGVLTCILLDQALKFWTVQTFTEGVFRDFIPGVLSLGLVYNTGAAWSLFSGAALPLAALRLLVGAGLVVYLVRRPVPPLTGVALMLIASGALSNSLDGWRLGKVVDTLSSEIFSVVTRLVGQGDFPIFNLADVWVVSGVALLLLLSWRTKPASPPSTSRPPSV